MNQVRRIYVEKKPEYAVRAKELQHEIQTYLGIKELEKVRVLMRYDIENISDATYELAKTTVFAEPMVDNWYLETFEKNNEDRVFTVAFLAGQFDQRADSAKQCIQLLNEEEDPSVLSATTYVFCGKITDAEFEAIKTHCVNPVDSEITKEEKPETLQQVHPEPEDIRILVGFNSMDDASLKELFQSLNLAMTFDDFKCIQSYFTKEEQRDPSMTEIRVLDTYWSDHCRHTTFLTEIKDVNFEEGYYTKPLKDSYDAYMEARKEIHKEGDYPCLMNLALIAMKKLRKEGKLQDMEVSDEINACSIIVPVEIDGKEEEWLVFFKNETHNHPTEIEPFGGAATCLGGAIRDPLSGRGYVYQAMRVTGAADPTVSLSKTLEGKLPQKKIVKGAASGYSSYGNQIGLATGMVNEVYHPNYVAKRMEIGAVMGAAPRKNVIREDSLPDDVIILIGGRTGRDGCGGATGSSKAHTSESIHVCGAEVQKGNAPTERKIQRLFRRSEVSSIIKKCNDFGAGGVSVAIGELADGLKIDLDKVPKKYAGLDGTELAISESQERMAVVVDPKDVDKMLAFSAEENLEAYVVARVTKEPRLVMNWRGTAIVDIKRSFLDTNGAHQETSVYVNVPKKETKTWNEKKEVKDIKESWLAVLKDLNVCSQKGLVEMFDSSIGAGTVTMPYGGQYQLTPIQTMIAKLPVLNGKCDTVTMMSYGLDPYLTSWSPYHGASYAIVDSVAKIVASGGDYTKIRFTFQEYFKRLGMDSERWGEPMAALLGAYDAQMKLSLPSIGGKDSMSGTFQDIDVPPTLCSFAVDTGRIDEVITPELKAAGNLLVSFQMKHDAYDLPDYDSLMNVYGKLYQLNLQKKLQSAYAIGSGGIVEAVSKMAFGNKLGVALSTDEPIESYFVADYGTIIAEIKAEDFDAVKEMMTDCNVIGHVTKEAVFTYGNTTISVEEALASWTKPLESVYPTKTSDDKTEVETKLYKAETVYTTKQSVARPKVFIPVFPGTNCEYDSAKAFTAAGADVTTIVFKNQNASDIKDSVAAYEKQIRESNIVMLPGGFSAGDEPDGSAKFIASVFRNPYLVEAVNDLLKQRDGLMLGICNGFQALIKLGLVPFGEIRPCESSYPTLTTNVIGRHISKVVYTKVVSNQSPWLQKTELGSVHAIPVSHGEGRFVASDACLNELFAKGQVATQYVDLSGTATMDETFNPNGSYAAIEGITSPDGRVLGKMGHSERIGYGVAQNIIGNPNQHLFESGISYFK